MRKYNITFSDDRIGNRFYYKADKEGFRRMRSFIFKAQNGLEKFFTDKLADACDNIRELEIGEQLYVISSEWEVYTAKSIEEFRDKVTRMERVCRDDLREYGEHYMPNPNKAFKVKRTAKQWQFASLRDEIA